MLTEASYSIKAAIDAINSDAKYVIIGDTIDGIEWLESTTPIAADVLNAKVTELKAAYDAEEYKRKRQAEYPAFEDQFDLIYHSGIEAWKAKIKEVKDKYPKS
jgi:hypothetical protein